MFSGKRASPLLRQLIQLEMIDPHYLNISSVEKAAIIFKLLNMLYTIDSFEHSYLSIVTFSNFTAMFFQSTSISWRSRGVHNIVGNSLWFIVSSLIAWNMLIIPCWIFFSFLLTGFFCFLEDQSSHIKTTHVYYVCQFFDLCQIETFPVSVFFN